MDYSNVSELVTVNIPKEFNCEIWQSDIITQTCANWNDFIIYACLISFSYYLLSGMLENGIEGLLSTNPLMSAYKPIIETFFNTVFSIIEMCLLSIWATFGVFYVVRYDITWFGWILLSFVTLLIVLRVWGKLIEIKQKRKK